MMRYVALLWFLLAPTVALAGKPEVVQLSPDTYMISKADHGGIFGGGLPKLRAAVIKQANEFAASKGKIAIPLSSSERPMGNGPAQWAEFEYQFRVVDKSDPEARRTSLAPLPDTTVSVVVAQAPQPQSQPQGQPQPQAQPAASSQPPAPMKGTERVDDLYNRLIKLDDLRKRGLITDAEFESEKRKLLAN
jgi:hypothetical protein